VFTIVLSYKKNMNRHPNIDYKNRNEPQVELESQFILRLPTVRYLYYNFISFRDITTNSDLISFLSLVKIRL